MSRRARNPSADERRTDVAASNTLYAAYAAADDAENEWQRRRLIAYVLREERPL